MSFNNYSQQPFDSPKIFDNTSSEGWIQRQPSNTEDIFRNSNPNSIDQRSPELLDLHEHILMSSPQTRFPFYFSDDIDHDKLFSFRTWENEDPSKDSNPNYTSQRNFEPSDNYSPLHSVYPKPLASSNFFNHTDKANILSQSMGGNTLDIFCDYLSNCSDKRKSREHDDSANNKIDCGDSSENEGFEDPENFIGSELDHERGSNLPRQSFTLINFYEILQNKRLVLIKNCNCSLCQEEDERIDDMPKREECSQCPRDKVFVFPFHKEKTTHQITFNNVLFEYTVITKKWMRVTENEGKVYCDENIMIKLPTIDTLPSNYFNGIELLSKIEDDVKLRYPSMKENVNRDYYWDWIENFEGLDEQITLEIEPLVKTIYLETKKWIPINKLLDDEFISLTEEENKQFLSANSDVMNSTTISRPDILTLMMMFDYVNSFQMMI